MPDLVGNPKDRFSRVTAHITPEVIIISTEFLSRVAVCCTGVVGTQSHPDCLPGRGRTVPASPGRPEERSWVPRRAVVVPSDLLELR